MNMYDILQKKRGGHALADDEIDYFLKGYVKGDIPDYQAAAFLMAVAINGMTKEETLALTLGIRNSGDSLEAAGIRGMRVDKHSTGGVGDKTSLIVMPIVAACGLTVAKMSGRGLGHTGGTVDKLEAIEGFRVELSEKELRDTVNTVGIAIVGQTKNLAPADKKLYALRDVTATVDSIPLIASSIMGKKLAVNDDCIVLDVKTGSGAFMKTKEDSIALARAMVEIGKGAGKKIAALVTDMNAPLGTHVGNLLEVKEALDILSGTGASDLRTLSVALAAEIFMLAEGCDRESAKGKAEAALDSGAAKERFLQMIEAQGGSLTFLNALAARLEALPSYEVFAPTEGYITATDTEGYGKAALLLGAGRVTLTDQIDPYAGYILKKKCGDYVKKGELLARLYACDASRFASAEACLLSATSFGEHAPAPRPLIYEKIE